MPRGGDKKDLDFQRWRNVEENNNENAFSSYKGLFIKKKSSQSRMTLAIFVKGNIKKNSCQLIVMDCKMCFDGNSEKL